MPKILTWIQLSDIHSKNSADDWDAERIIQRILEDIPAYCTEHRLEPDFLFFTGDAAWGSDPKVKASMSEQFAHTHSFLEKVRRSVTPVIPHAQVYLVPGNHDIDRNLISALTQNSLQRETLPNLTNWCQRNSLEWQECMRRLKPYYDFLREHKYFHLLTNPNHLYYAHSVKVRDYSVGIAGFNSAWSSFGGEEDRAKLRLLGHLQKETLNPMVRDSSVRVALIHHPFDWFHDQSDREIERNLAADYNFLLHGHEHSQWVLPAAPDQLGHNFTKIACGSCYQGSHLTNSYNVVRLDLDNGKGEVHLRTYSPAGRGGWIPLVLPGYAPEGIWPIPCLSISSKQDGAESPNAAEGDSTGAGNLQLGSQVIAQMDRPLTKTVSYDRLESVPRVHLPQCPEHAAIRVEQRNRFREIAAQSHLVWLVYDWRYAHDAFLAEALHNIGGINYTTDVFRIQCGDNPTCQDMIASAEKQIGMAFQEFLAALAGTQSAVILFEDVHRDLLTGSERAAFEQHIKDIQKFCPSALIVIGTRLTPHGGGNNVVEIQPLDQNDVLSYIRNHPEGRKHTFSDETLRRLTEWSGGLPFHIDNAIAQLPYATEDQIFDDPLTDTEYATHDGAPASLKIAVESLVNSRTKQSKASLLLLKVLTVLRDGETYDSVKRFDRSPFRPANVQELQTLRLLTVVPIARTSFSLHSNSDNKQESSILLVPRQVRDYVNSLLTPEELAGIRYKATDLLFGKKWRDGKLQPRRSLKIAYAESAIPGPGSEHVIALSLLQTAIVDNDSKRIARYADLCCRYCNTLLSEDRFRDCYIASYATYRQLKDSKLVTNFVEISHTLGKSLRMLGREEDAIPIVEEALRLGDKFLIPENKGAMHLTLALCRQSADPNLALDQAKKVLDLVHSESSFAFQANAVIANASLKGAERLTRLTELEERARNFKHMHTANNIALDIADNSGDVLESLKLIDRVLLTSRDNYNRVRAVVDKAQIVTKHRKYGQLTEDERKLLNAAYSYCYSQSIGTILNRCHKLLWSVFVKERLWGPLVRLFRFSSFNWRLLGRATEDLPYLRQIRELNVAEQLENDPAIEMELIYVKDRLASLPEAGESIETSEPEK